MAFDIGQYLSNIDNVELRTRLEADYKDQKAYSYFASGWMGEVELNPVSEQSEYILLSESRMQTIPASEGHSLESVGGNQQKIWKNS